MTEELLKKHLTTEEIIDFVSFETVNEKTLALASAVNGHIRECAECRQRVAAFGDIYEELCKIYGASDAKETIYCIMDDMDIEALEEKELTEALAVIRSKLEERNN